LCALEDINTKVIEDAGSGAETLNRDKMQIDLDSLAFKIQEMREHFNDLRERVEVISIPEITDIERIGEGLVATRAAKVHGVLAMLGYGNDLKLGGPDINYADLKASSIGSQNFYIRLRTHSASFIDIFRAELIPSADT
jgi:hypothetical protein